MCLREKSYSGIKTKIHSISLVRTTNKMLLIFTSRREKAIKIQKINFETENKRKKCSLFYSFKDVWNPPDSRLYGNLCHNFSKKKALWVGVIWSWIYFRFLRTRKSTFWIIYILSTEYMRNKINMQANGREWKHQKRSKRNYSTWMYRENTIILFLQMRSISSNFFNNWKHEASSLRYFSHMDNCYACENYYML